MHDAASGNRNVHQRILSTVLAIVVAIAVTFDVGAAQREPRDPTLFRGSVDLVNVGVTVAGKKKRLVTDLTVNDFTVYEDGKPQPIFAFASERSSDPRCTSASCSTSVRARSSISDSPRTR